MPLGGNLINQAKIDASQISFRTGFNSELMAVEDPLRELGMEVPSNAAVEDHDWLGTVPGLEEWLDERAVSEFRAEKITIRNKDWANGVKVVVNDILDDRLGLIMPKLGWLARMAGLHYGELLVDCLLAGFTLGGAFGNAYDGKAFFSTTHQDGNGPSQSNKGTAALSKTAYWSARATMRGYKDEKGRSLRIIPNTLIVGPSNEELALQIQGSQLINDGSNVQISNVAAQHRHIERVIVSESLVDSYANYWFLAALRPNQPKPLILQIREAITSAFSDLDWFQKKIVKYGAQSRDNAGFGLWQFIWGSDGSS